MLQIDDADHVRRLTLARPEALNAFNEALYDATTEAFIDARRDASVSVVVLTGTGRAFSTGTDVKEMAAAVAGNGFQHGKHGFSGLVGELVTFPKPLICAVNGLAVGLGATVLGFADLAFMASDARLRCPFTDLGVAPEAGSSFTFPALIGRQRAAWILMSSEWFSAEECREMGLVHRVCPPEQLLDVAMAHARVLAAKPLASLVETKQAIVAGWTDGVLAARRREDDAFRRLLGTPENLDALTTLADGGEDR